MATVEARVSEEAHDALQCLVEAVIHILVISIEIARMYVSLLKHYFILIALVVKFFASLGILIWLLVYLHFETSSRLAGPGIVILLVYRILKNLTVVNLQGCDETRTIAGA